MIIAVANVKGGVGKSTLARNLALTLAANNSGKLLAVDADPQGTLERFFRDRAERLDTVELSCIKKYEKGLRREIPALAAPYLDTVIDCGGRDTGTLREVLMISDVVLVPVTCGQESVDSFALMFEAIEDARVVNAKLRPVVVMNLCPTDAQDTMAVNAAKGLAEQYPEVTVLDTMIKNRKPWLKSGIGGHAIWEIDGGRSKAADDFNSLIQELSDLEVI